MSTLCHNCGFYYQQRLPKTFPGLEWSSLTMAFTGKIVYITSHFFLLRLNPVDLSVDREGC